MNDRSRQRLLSFRDAALAFSLANLCLARAWHALLEEKIGTMLPCNVIVIDKENGTTEVSAVNPIASMMAIQNPSLEPIAAEVTEKLKRVIGSL